MGDIFPKTVLGALVPVDSNDLDKQIQFARHNFDNHQSLIRASDAKAGATVTIMVFLAASALQISKEAIAKLHLRPCSVAIESGLFILASVGLLVSVLWSFIAAHRVLRPRGARFTSPQKGRELMWQDHVLLHQNNEEYFSAVRTASPEVILRNTVEGHINRLKLIKRHMYGRANLDLLRIRVLHTA